MMMRGNKLDRSFLPVLFTLVAICPIFGCAPEKMTGPTQQETVMSAQQAASGNTPPMRADEADAIYKHYVDGIGKPVNPTSGLSNTTP